MMMSPPTTQFDLAQSRSSQTWGPPQSGGCTSELTAQFEYSLVLTWFVERERCLAKEDAQEQVGLLPFSA